MSPLKAVPDLPPRAVLYLRQSVTRDDSVSLELQETACRDYCARKGYEVTAVHSDPGISGRTWKRPGVVKVLDMIESGGADIIVLWRWSRLSRSRRDWALAIDRVEVAGGRIESATEPVDVSTAAGRLARGMLTEIAAWDSEVKGETWREAHLRRLKAGLPHSGKPRFGYTYDLEKKMHVPDPETGPVLAGAYRRYIAGESVYSLVRWLNSNGFRTTEGNLWRDRVLRRMLDSGFAAGRLTYGEGEYRGIHETLITPDEWAAYQAQRRARRVVPARTTRSPYLLSGMIRCVCGSSMTAGQFGHARQAKYRCADSKERGSHGGGGYVMAHLAEGAVIEWVRRVADDIETVARVERDSGRRADRQRSTAAALARRITKLDEQLAQLTRKLLDGTVPQSAYELTRDQMLAERATLEVRMTAASDAASLIPHSPRATAIALLAEWETLPIETRRNVLRELVARVVVTPGRPRATMEVVPAWHG